jgi:hypothetical protein
MNELIEQLIGQIGFTERDLSDGRDQMLVEFAKLVASDIVEIVQWYPEVHTQKEQDVLNQAVARILEVYGIKDEQSN